MKRFALLMTMLSTSAFAGIADYGYQVKAGEFNISSHYAYQNDFYEEMGDAFDGVGNPIKVPYETEIDLTWLNNKLSYGLTNNLNLALDLNYRISHSYDTEVDSEGEGDYDDTGFEDPKFTFTYRLTEEAPTAVDLNLGMILPLGKSDGENALRGGGQVSFGTDITHKVGIFEYFSGVNFDFNFKRETKDGATTRPSRDMQTYIGGQINAFAGLYLNAAFEYELVGKSNNNTIIYEKFGPKFGLRYAFTDSLMIKGDVRFFTSTEYDSNAKYQGQEFVKATLGASYTF